MNQTIALLQDHRSDRSFSDKAVSDADLDAIIKSGYRAPTSCNGQHVSVVVTRDATKRARIAELAGGQPWVAKAPVFLTVVLDLYKTEVGVAKAGSQQANQRCMEGIIMGSTDVGIALATMGIAARSLGLGFVPIGGIRNSPQEMIDLLELPPLCFAVVGMSVGHVDAPSQQRPRMDIATFRHEETYQREGLEKAIDDYDTALQNHWKSLGRLSGENWSRSIAPRFDKNIRPRIKPTLAKQGMTFTE